MPWCMPCSGGCIAYRFPVILLSLFSLPQSLTVYLSWNLIHGYVTVIGDLDVISSVARFSCCSCPVMNSAFPSPVNMDSLLQADSQRTEMVTDTDGRQIIHGHPHWHHAISRGHFAVAFTLCFISIVHAAFVPVKLMMMLMISMALGRRQPETV